MSNVNQLGKYQPYPDYKDSGVEWLGAIPTHWFLHALKRSVSGCVNGIWGDEPNGDNDLIVLRVADFDRNKLIISDDKLTYRSISEKERKNRLLKKGDLLIEKSGGGEKTLVGCVVLFDKEYAAVTSNFVAKMTPNPSFHGGFLNYAFDHLYSGRVNYPSIKQTTGIQNLDSESYLMEHFCFPVFSEQRTIAAFLDYETARIDQLIAKQQQLIELLKEKRQAVISHAVTKGLNPNAPMKDSGVEWLGQVPEHWDVSALKRFWFVVDCKHITAEFFDEGIPLASIREVQSWAVDLSDAKKTSEEYYKVLIEGNRLPEDGDIIFSRNATVGEAARVTMNHPPFAMGQDVCLLKKSIPSIDTDFFMHQLKSRVVSYQLDTLMVGSTFKRINVDDIRNFIVVMPPEEEAVDIRKYLNSMVSKYRRLEQTALDQVALLQERRTALISAAVTGKIDLRGWQPPKCEVAA